MFKKQIIICVLFCFTTNSYAEQSKVQPAKSENILVTQAKKGSSAVMSSLGDMRLAEKKFVKPDIGMKKLPKQAIFSHNNY